MWSLCWLSDHRDRNVVSPVNQWSGTWHNELNIVLLSELFKTLHLSLTALSKSLCLKMLFKVQIMKSILYSLSLWSRKIYSCSSLESFPDKIFMTHGRENSWIIPSLQWIKIIINKLMLHASNNSRQNEWSIYPVIPPSIILWFLFCDQESR